MTRARTSPDAWEPARQNTGPFAPTRIVAEAPIDVTDLPGYTVRLADSYAANPDLVRLITWQRLARGDDQPHAMAVASTKAKVDAIAAAQTAGTLPDDLDAAILLTLVIHIAALWAMSSPDVLDVVGRRNREQRRAAIRDSVESIISR